MSDNKKPSVDQRLQRQTDSPNKIVQIFQKYDPISYSYSYTVRVINDVDDRDSGKAVVTVRNNQTGKLVTKTCQDIQDVREKGIQVPNLNQILTADRQ